ncbi:NUDIX hydrolase [Aquipuribacter hungaricus]|uniref:NUDIX domain-containing protein n=1 Tax=Aquipuribacter hungaricus TaxID=545624 RepID=A0ABV7WFG1_9MICO
MVPGTAPTSDLLAFPRPSVAVDTAVLTVAPRADPAADQPVLQLQVLLVRRDGADGRATWSLPGTFLHERERLQDAVMRSLATKVGIRQRARTTEIGVFDDPYRDDRGWVLSAAHLAALPLEAVLPAVEASDGGLRLVPASRPPSLLWDHGAIVRRAREELQRHYTRHPDPFTLLGPAFTMTELRQVHEAVLSRVQQKDTFRRLMEPQLRATSRMSSGTVGRPSQVYGRKR